MRSEITFPAKLARSGNAAHIIVSGRYMEMLGVGIGDDVDVTIRIPEQRDPKTDGEIRISRLKGIETEDDILRDGSLYRRFRSMTPLRARPRQVSVKKMSRN